VAPRRRSTRKRGWPDNLYEDDGYFSWRNPTTGEKFGISRNRATAFTQAIEANIHIQGLRDKPRLIDRLTGSAGRTVEKWNEMYQGMLAKADYAPKTLITYKSLGKRMVERFTARKKIHLESITALDVSEILAAIAVDEGHPRTALQLRTFMHDSFREARVQGWYTGDNPVMDTRLPISVEVKRSRLSLEVYLQVYERTPYLWLRNAMDVALVSAQRREDIACARFKDFRDGGWWCVQQSRKGENLHKILIPLDLRLNALGKSLADVVSQCRKTSVASKYLVHQTVARPKCPVGHKIAPNTITMRFRQALSALKLDWGEKNPPSFHEIRSLSERLYRAQGGINTQQLLGHEHAATTELYDDPRGSEWVKIEVTV
jgi:integrase